MESAFSTFHPKIFSLFVHQVAVAVVAVEAVDLLLLLNGEVQHYLAYGQLT